MRGRQWRPGGGGDAATRHGDIADLKEAAAEIIPAEMEKAIPPVIRDLAKQPDPWEPKG